MYPRVDDEVRFEDPRGLLWVVQRPYRRAIEEHVAEMLAESPRSPRLVPVKEAQRRQVYRLLVPGAGWWMVKRYPPKRTWQGSLREWLPSRASREHRMGTELRRRGLPTPFPIALAERRAGGRWREAFLLHECIVGAEPLGTYLEARTAAGDGCGWKLSLVRRAVERFRRDHEVIDVDGARVQLGDGWGLVRASNTGPVLVLRFEAATPERLQEIRAWFEGELRAVQRELGVEAAE